jgi:nucleotide-binding universal stress UspA family protein
MMTKARPVLVGVSDSPGNDAAVWWAVQEATARGRPLRLIHVYQWQPVVPGSPFYSMIWGTHEPPEVRQAAADILIRATELAHAANPTLDIHGDVLEGERDVVLRAEAHHAALLVLGSRPRHTRGGSHYRRLRALARRLTVPVIIARPSPGRRSQPVIVAVDRDNLAPPILAFAYEHAARHHAAVHVLVRDQSARPANPPAPPPRTWLEELNDTCRTAGLDTPDIATLIAPEHTATLLDTATRASMIVTAHRHHRPTPGRRSPSLDSLLIRHATCPVTLIPPDQQTLPTSRLQSFLQSGDRSANSSQ